MKKVFLDELPRWEKCEEFALSNLAKNICDYWNQKEEWETTKTIASNNSWGIKAPVTIIDYLKKGTKLGWCHYDPKEEKLKASSKAGKLKGKRIEIFKDSEILGVFESATELARQSEGVFGIKLIQSCISKVCIGKKPQYKGFTFKYAEE